MESGAPIRILTFALQSIHPGVAVREIARCDTRPDKTTRNDRQRDPDSIKSSVRKRRLRNIRCEDGRLRCRLSGNILASV